MLSDGSGVYDHHPRIDQGRALGNSGGCDIQGRTVYWDSDRDAMMRALLPSEP